MSDSDHRILDLVIHWVGLSHVATPIICNQFTVCLATSQTRTNSLLVIQDRFTLQSKSSLPLVSHVATTEETIAVVLSSARKSRSEISL